MEQNKLGKKEIPDFKEMDDRIFREPSDSPRIVIETNLDAKNVKDGNPYSNRINSEGFEDYFEK
ncbi:hypothetical protein MPH61_00175 [Peribacillus muralis]|uniref:hypothetical protein n=1 Tax=Peribacillus muralis TaxID=264697 RepID=UPI001F4E0C02|nr:hypothetical protein [Peribacillus muralis]MCK1991006.1 hypothetical protein [Peribacillus muralis]MCK2011560.1 hypothetical protein [Peribacillus muralis]